MASLLLYVDPERLDEILGAGNRTLGRRVMVARATLPAGIERLDEQSTLFLVTVERGRALVVASVDDLSSSDGVGDATIHDHDITELLERLGCDKVWRVRNWATTPRIVPPSDVELLRYHLGLALATEASAVPVNAPLPVFLPPAPAPVPPIKAKPVEIVAPIVADAQADSLAADVFANPASDAPRRAYAKRLDAIGDPRGELIALQLARVACGEPVSERERALVERYGPACAEPLRPYLDSFELRRGFVWKCQLACGLAVPDAIRDEPAWATIEDIATTDDKLLGSRRMVSLRRARITGPTFNALGCTDGLLTIETLLPYPAANDAQPPRGISFDFLDARTWLDVIDGGAFMRARSLCLDGTELGGRLPQLLESTFGRRLSHLDAWIEPSAAMQWRETFDRIELPLLTLRFATHGIEPVFAFERRDGAHRMVVELRATVSAEIAGDLAKLIARLGTGITALEIVDTSLAPFPAQQPDLVNALGSTFTTVELRRGDSLALV